MKKFPLVLAVVYGTLCTSGVAQKTPLIPEAIVPGSNPDTSGSAQRVSGAGMCRVHFDHDGQVASVSMIRSTGSAELDEDALRSAHRNWHGLPDTTLSVPVKYNTAPMNKGGTIRYETPIPSYPIWMERAKLSGTCLLQILFAPDGSATFAVVLRSSGSTVLDNFTVRHALTYWKSSGGEESVLTYPVRYVYREAKGSPADRLTVPGLEFTTGH